MEAKCKQCGDLIFDEDGQCYGRQEPDGSGLWICDECDDLSEEDPHPEWNTYIRYQANAFGQ